MLSDIRQVVERQRAYFMQGENLDVSFRIEQLKRLKRTIQKYEEEIVQALHDDLGRSHGEALLTDVVPTITEIDETIHGLRRWARPECHFSGLMCFPSLVTKVYKMPYGVTLIISPFNFPILLTFGVLAASIAGGNTAVVKPSSKSENCTRVLKKIIEDCFNPAYVTLIEGGHDVADECLAQRFDKIFYTGSPAVGKHVMESAAKNLTPVALELGGETGNWCIVRKDADLKDAARKIAFFKCLNAGQICININQVAVAEEVAEEFIEELKSALVKQVGEHPFANEAYPKLINRNAYDKCAQQAEVYRDRIRFGGEGNAETCKYSPTIIYPVKADEPIVMHELFSPLLPIVPYKDNEVNQLMATIAQREHPLSMYIFTANKRWAKRMMRSQQYGGGCVNEVCLHLMVKGVPFGGTGHSGMGAYHGVWGFREFTHPSTVLMGSTKLNLPLREHPYNDTKIKLLKLFTK